MMENTGIEALLGNPNAPWINQAVQTYGVAGNYYGVNANPGGGHVLTIVIRGGHTHLQAASFTPYNHYSMLRTIEDSWHLGCLANTCHRQSVPAMNDLVDRRR